MKDARKINSSCSYQISLTRFVQTNIVREAINGLRAVIIIKRSQFALKTVIAMLAQDSHTADQRRGGGWWV